MYPVKIVRVLSEGALVQFSDGSTRQIMPEIINAWKRFGIDVAEGNLSREDIRLYNVAVKEFPHYSGIETADQPEIPWAAKNITEALEGAPEVVPEVIVDTPKVIEDVPDVSMVPEVTADSPLYTGHFGQGWLPDFGHNAKVLYLRELERLREKWGTDVPPETSMEILEEGPIEDIVTTPKITVPQVSVIDLADTKDLPNTIKAAQNMGSIFYKGAKGRKKLALYKEQLQNFRESISYMEGRGSANDQARRWMEAQIAAGNEIDFEAVGGEARFYTEDYETVIDRLTLPDAGAAEVTVDLTKSDFEQERTAEALQAELDAIEKERAALNQDLELGTSPGWQAPMPISRVGEVTKGGVGDFGDYSVRAPRVTDFQTDVTDTRMPVATGIPYGVPSAMDEGMAEGYMYASPGEAAVAGLIPRMTDTLPAGGVGDFSTVSNLPADLQEALTKGEGLGDAFIKAQVEKAQAEALADVPWEERYPLAPQGSYLDEVDTSLAGLADNQWIDPHPNAINVDLGEYYKIPLDQRDKIYKPPESRWDASRSGGSVWDRERRANIEGRGMVDEFGEIQKQAEQDAIEKAAFDRWMEDIQTNRYVAEKDLEGEYGPNRLEEVWTSEMMPTLEDTAVGFLDQPWTGVDEYALPYDIDKRYGDRRTEVGDFADVMVEEPAVTGDVPAFKYNGELWYLTKQGHYAKDYKRSELVTPWQTLPSDFF
jgi:hypothetical protein